MSRREGSWTLPAALALLAMLFAIQVRQTAPPTPLGVDADQGDFSAGRARDELSNLLGDETPHPVGSAANRAVKERLIARLTELGLRPEEQRTIGCAAESATCAQVENVLAAIPGRTADTIVLMAHYDSVPNAPGAGDDGAAVAALLEVARIVKAGAPYRNTILLAFTDAEETGLLGAEAFFAEHPAAKRARAVINLEGSGSAGPVYLLRTGPASGELMAAFRNVAPHPVAQSFTEEIFKRMPNDTDFSVSLRAGLPGIDFAFAGERNHYHTPLDSIANLDLGTLQHHGENTLPLLRSPRRCRPFGGRAERGLCQRRQADLAALVAGNGDRAGRRRTGAAPLRNLARSCAAAATARRGRHCRRHAGHRRRRDARGAVAGRPPRRSASRLARKPLAVAHCAVCVAAARRRARRSHGCAPRRTLRPCCSARGGSGRSPRSRWRCTCRWRRTSSFPARSLPPPRLQRPRSSRVSTPRSTLPQQAACRWWLPPGSCSHWPT